MPAVPPAAHPAPPSWAGARDSSDGSARFWQVPVVEHESFRVALSRADVDGVAGKPLVLVDADMLDLDEAEALIAALRIAVGRARG